MSSNNSHNEEFTHDDIRRYVEGEMSPAEMHKMEMSALADPFLADAIEGMRLSREKYGTAAFEAGVSDLKNRLKTKRRGWNVGIAWRIAAVLLVVITGIALTYLLQQNEKQEKSSMSQVTTIPNAPKPDSAAESSTKNETHDSSSQLEEIQSQKRSLVTKPAAPKKEESPKVQQSEITDKEMEEVSITTAPVAVQRDTQAYRKYEAASAAKSEDVQQSLEGRAAGVVVNRSKRPDEFTSIVFEPEGGWPAFHQYITKNKNIPDSVSALHGITNISFTIDAGGLPTDIRFKKSLTPAHNSEVIRLLQNGPRWKVLKGDKRRVDLPLIF